MLEEEKYAEEGAADAFEKALMFTLDAYSHSGLVTDEEIAAKLEGVLRHFRRGSGLDRKAPAGIEAYVLLNCDLGLEETLMHEILAIPAVSDVKGVFGVYDIIVRVFGDSEQEIKSAIASIRGIAKIKSSLTMMVIDGQAENGVRLNQP